MTDVSRFSGRDWFMYPAGNWYEETGCIRAAVFTCSSRIAYAIAHNCRNPAIPSPLIRYQDPPERLLELAGIAKSGMKL